MSDRALREIMKRAILERFGLTFSPSRASALERGIERAAAALEDGSVPMLLARLQGRDPHALGALADELTIAETYFFRDANSFSPVEEAVKRAELEGRTVRVWSAGCATGEEAYSLAIRALLARGTSTLPIEIIGTDLSPRAIAAAERAVYRAWSFRGVPDEVRERWFEPIATGFRPRQEVRDVVRFRVANLLDADAAPSYVDVAFCRNVFIYLDETATARAVQALVSALNPSGVLVLGPSDPLVQDPRIRIDQSGGFVSYRRIEPMVATGAALFGSTESRAPPHASKPHAESPRTSRQAPKQHDRSVVVQARPLAGAKDDTLRARSLADRGDLDGALALLKNAHDDAGLLVRAIVAHGMGDYDSALRDARVLTARDAPPPLAHILEAMALVEMGDAASAREAMNRGHAAISALPAGAEIGNGARASDALATLLALKSRLSGRVPRRRRKS